MILWDVNVLVYAFRSDSPLHDPARDVITGSITDGDPFLLYPFVAASFVRLVTNPRIFAEPSDQAEAWRFLDYLETSPGARHGELDPEAYGIFRHFCLTTASTGNAVPDALLAAAALRHDADLVTADRGFARFPGLSVQLLV